MISAWPDGLTWEQFLGSALDDGISSRLLVFWFFGFLFSSCLPGAGKGAFSEDPFVAGCGFEDTVPFASRTCNMRSPCGAASCGEKCTCNLTDRGWQRFGAELWTGLMSGIAFAGRNGSKKDHDVGIRRQVWLI
jgi:hypothetical protein